MLASLADSLFPRFFVHLGLFSIPMLFDFYLVWYSIYSWMRNRRNVGRRGTSDRRR